jgi:plasmid stabilization system protein ParE
MRSGYKVNWTAQAKKELDKTYRFLIENWTNKEIEKLSLEVEKTISLIAENPKLFQITDEKNVRRAVILKLNSMFYYIDNESKTVTIISFFNNRKEPK